MVLAIARRSRVQARGARWRQAQQAARASARDLGSTAVRNAATRTRGLCPGTGDTADPRMDLYYPTGTASKGMEGATKAVDKWHQSVCARGALCAVVSACVCVIVSIGVLMNVFIWFVC